MSLLRPIPQAVIDMIEYVEGERLVAYPDGNLWADGFGHDSPDIHEGTTITDAQAKAQLQPDSIAAGQRVQNLLGELRTKSLTEGQWAALVDFSYNAGTDPAQPIWEHVLSAPGQVPTDLSQRITNKDGVALPGLILRRNKEILMWCSTGSPSFTPPTAAETAFARTEALRLNSPN